jgi:hypothetical protein
MTSEDKPAESSVGPGSPATEDEWIIHSVNIHGVFFERACRKIIDESKSWWVSSHNVPVEFPPPTDHSRGRESNLDIWAVYRHTSGFDGGLRVLSLLIECKKNNPEFVKWIFFPKQVEKTRLRRGSSADRVAIRDVAIWHDPNSPKGWKVLPRVMRSWTEFHIPRVDEARETRGSYREFKTAGSKTKTANTAVSEACYQVALATQAIFLSESQYLMRKLERAEPSAHVPPQGMPWFKQLFIPVVVTTAQLFTCDFSPDDIDPVSGVLPFSKAAITERPQVLYEYPLPRHLQAMPLFPEVTRDEGDTELFNRMHIWVVNSGHFGEFLEGMAKDADALFNY